MSPRLSSSKTIKFLYSYGGKIVVRPRDGKLRYFGGFTRVLSVDRSITCSGLLVKFGESCGSSMDLKCKLPTEDLDLLVSIKSDEELRILIEEYERVSPEAKIKAVLFPMKSVKKVSPPSSPMSCFDFASVSKSHEAAPLVPRYRPAPPCAPFGGRLTWVVGYHVAAVKHCCYEARSSRHLYNAPHLNYSHQQ